MKWKIDDFDERVRRFTYHKPIFKESDGIGRNIQRKIIYSNEGIWSRTQYVIGEFGQAGKINGIGFSFNENGQITEGNCFNGTVALETKEIFANKEYCRRWLRNGNHQGYFYQESDSEISEGYYRNGVFKGHKKVKEDNSSL